MTATNWKKRVLGQRKTMLAFQLVGLAFTVLFLGALVTDSPRTAR
jgi:hypothetical protein